MSNSPRFLGLSLVVLVSLACLGSCSEDDPTLQASASGAARAGIETSYGFRATDWPQPAYQRIARNLGGAHADTVAIDREPIGNGRLRLSTMTAGGRLLGTQVVDSAGGILEQEGFEDTSAWKFTFGKPLRDVPVRALLQPDGIAPEQVDTVPFKVESRAGRVRSAVAIHRVQARRVPCPSDLSGTCIEFEGRSGFVLDGKVSGYSMRQLWNSDIGPVEYRTSTEAGRRILP
jgi:hypothetical protein